jgi:flagellar hook assembly protein FlgD
VPNPTSSSTSISVNLDNTSDVEVEVYNINGSRVKAISMKNLSSGNQSIEIDANDLQTGTYIVKLVANGKVATSKFIKL